MAFDNLKQLEGVDEKLMGRPEIAHLRSMLIDGEQPEWIMRCDGVSVLVATDRRVIHIRRSRWGDLIRDVQTFPDTHIR